MDDPLSPVRDEAVLALGNFGKLAEPVLPQLCTLVTQANSPQRCKAASSLWQLTRDTQFVLPHMIEHLRVGNLEWEAAEVLGIMGPAAAPAVTALVKALEGDESLQIAAAEALGNIGPAARRAVPVLQQLLESEDADIRQVAQQAIDKIQASR